MPKTKAVALDDIVLDERCQTRAILNQEAVTEYKETYEAEEVTLPALQVAQVGDDLLLLDGFHRLAGARSAGKSFIRVEVVEKCDLGRALWLASAMNQGHGVRRTNADKRQAVKLALESDVGEEQSLRVIAEHVGVSHELVRVVKDSLSETDTEPPEDEAPEPPETPDDEPDRPEPDMYHTAGKRIRTCYKKVCAILGEDDDVCEQLYRALEAAKEREL